MHFSFADTNHSATLAAGTVASSARFDYMQRIRGPQQQQQQAKTSNNNKNYIDNSSSNNNNINYGNYNNYNNYNSSNNINNNTNEGEEGQNVSPPLSPRQAASSNLSPNYSHNTSNLTNNNSNAVKLTVCVRMRPIIEEDFKHATTKRNSPEICVHFKSDGQTIKLIQDQHHFKNFKVDHTFDTACGQRDVYHVALRPIVRDVIKGYNGTCLVYGQTASGKTYTMFGSENKLGVAHLAINEIFDAVQQYENDDLVSKVFISFYQIYLENIYDLLGEVGVGFDKMSGPINGYGPNWANSGIINGFGASATLSLDMKQQTTLPSLNIREDSERGAYVESLNYCYAKDRNSAFQLIQDGLQRRKVNSTAYNVKSSRSHAILQIYCDFEERNNEPPLHGESEIKHGSANSQYNHCGLLIEKKYMVRRRTLTLVDLAGSERVQTFKQSTKKQLQEASVINKSIAALGNCIYALSQKEQNNDPNVHIPYRDCKLTRLLSESLGGNAKTSIIANISPCVYNYEETCSTLKFAARAKVIRKVVRRAKYEEIVVQSKMLNYFSPFPQPEQAEHEEVNVLRDVEETAVDRFVHEYGDDPNQLNVYVERGKHRPPLPPRRQPQFNLQEGGTFSLRDFLKACTLATKVGDPMDSVEYEVTPSPEVGSFAPIPPMLLLPDMLEAPTRRTSFGTVSDNETLTIATPAYTPRPGYSSVPSKVDSELDDGDLDDQSLSPFPNFRTESPIPNRRRSVSSSNNSALSILTTGEAVSLPNRDTVSLPSRPSMFSPESVSSMGSNTTRGSKVRFHKGVQTWNLVPETPTQAFNGSLDDFGTYRQATKIDQATEIDGGDLLDAATDFNANFSGRAEVVKLSKLSPFELALFVVQLRDQLSKMEEDNKLLKELLVGEVAH